MLILPINDLKKQEVLSKIAFKFEKNKMYSEEQVNKIIASSFNIDDISLFRRELINFDYLGKDSYKGIYWLKNVSLSKEKLLKISKNSKKIKDFQ